VYTFDEGNCFDDVVDVEEEECCGEGDIQVSRTHIGMTYRHTGHT
jgi:hypothetical protein